MLQLLGWGAVVATFAVALGVVALVFTPQGCTAHRFAVVALGGLCGGVALLLLAAFLWAGLSAQQPRHQSHTTRHRATTHLPSHTSPRRSGFTSQRSRGYYFMSRARP